MRRAGWLTVVLGASAAAFVLFPYVAGVEAREGAATATIPDRLAGYSYLTANLTNAPSGRAVALYQHGWGVEFMDYPQAVVLAADDDIYRRLDAAEARGGPESQGDPGPMLLSPDGLWVALGKHNATRASFLGVVDLRTGEVAQHALPDIRSVLPVAWSPDGSQVAYLSGDEPTNPYLGTRILGDLYVLDLESGNASATGVERAVTAAFSPDGEQLAVHHASGNADDLSIVDLSSGAVRAVPVEGRLAGPAAWSPDGRLLALSTSSGLAFVDPEEVGQSPPIRLEIDEPRRQSVLGWTGDREVAVFDESGNDVARVVAHPLDGSASRELTSIGNLGSYGVGRFQLASALLMDAEVRAAGDADRGPLPTIFRVLVVAAAGLVVALLMALVRRLRRRPPAASTVTSADSPPQPVGAGQ